MKTWTAMLVGALGGAAIASVGIARSPSLRAVVVPASHPPLDEPDPGGRAEGERGRSVPREARPLPATAEVARLVAAVGAEQTAPLELRLRTAEARNRKLQAQLATDEEQLRRSLDPDRKVRPYEMTPDQLRRLASHCALSWDMPSLGGRDRVNLDDAASLGLDDNGQAAINRVFDQNDQWLSSRISAIYVSVTGDQAGASSLSLDGMWHEIEDKSPHALLEQVFQRLSAERAGLVPVSTVPAGQQSGVEQLFRLLTDDGNRVEKEIADQLGPDIARRYRDLHNGFSSRWTSSYGCPDAPASPGGDGEPGAEAAQ